MKLQQAYAIESPRRREINTTQGAWAGFVAAGILAASIALVVVGMAAVFPGHQVEMKGPQAPPVVISQAGSNQQAQKPESPPTQPAIEPAGANRKKAIAEESARLLRMATELKAEVDKTTKDTLSMQVIRKAAEIERLARDVKGSLKPQAKAK